MSPLSFRTAWAGSGRATLGPGQGPGARGVACSLPHAPAEVFFHPLLATLITRAAPDARRARRNLD